MLFVLRMQISTNTSNYAIGSIGYFLKNIKKTGDGISKNFVNTNSQELLYKHLAPFLTSYFSKFSIISDVIAARSN